MIIARHDEQKTSTMQRSIPHAVQKVDSASFDVGAKIKSIANGCLAWLPYSLIRLL